LIRSAVDNDVLLKLARYQLVSIWLASLPPGALECGMLGAAKFLVRKKLGKLNRQPALDAFEEALDSLTQLEPSTEELRLAADYENAAQKLGVQLDSGESQLCAIVVTRDLRYFFTGDKRAMVALSQLIKTGAIQLSSLYRKIVCLERTMLWLMDSHDLEQIRLSIRRDKDADITLSICFSVSAETANEQSVRDGLTSYISSLGNDCAVEILR
jgi:hypothetical protein